jgi:hypothetical protein
LLQHVLKNKRYLWNTWANGCVPLDEFKVLYKVNCFDAHAVEKGNGIATINVKKCSNNATNIGTNFDNAFHPGYHPQTFNGGLQKFAMHFNKLN